jgi:uroporphyrin-III C-methyltransferase/precorrin-2 dehydrogenase/sirohydrochlorin ferrochelatase
VREAAARAASTAVAAALDTGAVPLRRHRRGPGRVVLVGGGPGDPGLLTLRGRRALAEADVVVVDRLAPLAVLEELHDGVEVIDVGKAPDHHPVPQTEINAILVDRARAGLRVVRLKGGDGYVLGRGGEEVAACRDAGVPCEVVPGVSSALAVPAAAGIPVTHRGVSRSVTVTTGHEVLDPAEARVLAALTGTLVVLMGVSRLSDLCQALVAAGRCPTTPVAIVERGCTPQQRTTTATLATAADRAVARGVAAPAVVVVGAVAAMATGPGTASGAPAEEPTW